VGGVLVLVFVRPSKAPAAAPGGVSYETEGESAGRSRRTAVR
jgi:hypothetical protein